MPFYLLSLSLFALNSLSIFFPAPRFLDCAGARTRAHAHALRKAGRAASSLATLAVFLRTAFRAASPRSGERGQRVRREFLALAFGPASSSFPWPKRKLRVRTSPSPSPLGRRSQEMGHPSALGRPKHRCNGPGCSMFKSCCCLSL